MVCMQVVGLRFKAKVCELILMNENRSFCSFLGMKDAKYYKLFLQIIKLGVYVSKVRNTGLKCGSGGTKRRFVN